MCLDRTFKPTSTANRNLREARLSSLLQTKNKAENNAPGLTEKRWDKIKQAVGVVCTHGLR